jgi:glycosyltransferase involved in cell wall biosynthesis
MRPMTALNRTVFERKHGRPSYTDGDRVEPFSSHQPPGLTIVIVARDAGKMLRGTLEAAAGESRCHDGSTQLVVVDNGSQDETALVLAEHRRCLSRSLSLIRLPRPVEAPHALDIGRARAIGRVIRIAHPGDRPSF